MNGALSPGTAAPKESQTDKQLYALEHAIDRLNERLSDLESRLGTVLDNRPIPVGPQEATDKPETLCELASCLRIRVAQVTTAGDRVNALISRLEL
jgi:hypothetical protein